LPEKFDEDIEKPIKFINMADIKDFCKIFSVWEMFSNMLLVYKDILMQDNIKAKDFLMSHFMKTQNQRPEFLFNLILMYLSEDKYLKVEQLIDQFKMQDFQTQIYRQFKTSSILMIQMKIYCNIERKFEQAIECANYLTSIA